MPVEYNKLKLIINTWDPIDLLAIHAPNDEYTPEINDIYEKINNTSTVTVNSVAEIIYDAFIKWFGNDVFLKSLDDCKQIAKQLLG